MTKVSAILLAAGLSTRMKGQNKLLLPWRGRPLLAHVMENLQQSKADELIIVTNEKIQDFLLSDPPETQWKQILNPEYHKGMMTSLQYGIKATDPATKGFLICLADMPLISREEYDHIISQFSDDYPEHSEVVIVPLYDGQNGHPVLFSATYRNELILHQEPEGPRSVLAAHTDQIHYLNMQKPHIIYDVDTPLTYNNLISDT